MQLLLSNKYNQRALAAYWKTAQEGAPIPRAQSDLYEDDQGKYYVVLSNSTDILAVYRVRNDDVLKRLKRWPNALRELYP